MVKSCVMTYTDFPRAGISFKDIFGVLKHPEALVALLDILKARASDLKGQVDCVVGLDARGFLFGPLMASHINVPFVPVRKHGKLPGRCISTSYKLEYGDATVELQKDAFDQCQKDSDDGKTRVLLIDDLLATGGTMLAATKLVNSCPDAKATHAFVILELASLNGAKQLDKLLAFSSLIQY